MVGRTGNGTSELELFDEQARSYLNTVFCQQLRDGGFSDWRTATAHDLFTLDPAAFAKGVGVTASAAAAARIWMIDESFFFSPDSAPYGGEIYLRSLDRYDWDVVPYGPTGLIGAFRNSNGTLIDPARFTPGPAGLPGFAVFCVRGH